MTTRRPWRIPASPDDHPHLSRRGGGTQPTGYDGLQAAGHESHAKLLGVFQVSVLHNIVHLLFGVAGIALARTSSSARAFLVGGGAVYLALWLYGLVVDKSSQANFVPLNTADDWLHLVLGIGMVALGVVLGRNARAAATH